jgi:hypothetical protein
MSKVGWRDLSLRPAAERERGGETDGEDQPAEGVEHVTVERSRSTCSCSPPRRQGAVEIGCGGVQIL